MKEEKRRKDPTSLMDFDTSQVIHKVKTLNIDLNLETPFESKKHCKFLSLYLFLIKKIITSQDANTTKVSVLDIFDPLTESGEDEEEPRASSPPPLVAPAPLERGEEEDVERLHMSVPSVSY